MGQHNSSCLPVDEVNHEHEEFIHQTTVKKVHLCLVVVKNFTWR